MRSFRSFGLFLAILLLLATTIPGQAFKNACQKCSAIAEATDVVCPKCSEPLNRCSSCKEENPVCADYCLKCGDWLAEMRVLDSIDPDLREELKLGQSDRAQLEKKLANIEHQLTTEPEKAEKLLVQKAKAYQKMNFPAKTVAVVQEFLKKFPESKKAPRAKVVLSDSLRRWGNLFFEQGNKKLAREKFEQATVANPLNAEAWQWLGRVRSEASDQEGASEAYLAALQARPGDKTSIHFLRTLKTNIPKELLKPAAPKEFKTQPKEFDTKAPTSEPSAPAEKETAVEEKTPEVPVGRDESPESSPEPTPEPSQEEGSSTPD